MPLPRSLSDEKLHVRRPWLGAAVVKITRGSTGTTDDHSSCGVQPTLICHYGRGTIIAGACGGEEMANLKAAGSLRSGLVDENKQQGSTVNAETVSVIKHHIYGHQFGRVSTGTSSLTHLFFLAFFSEEWDGKLSCVE
jgi:hypothetical protein